MTESSATGALDDLRVAVHPGSGVVARLPGVVLVAPGPTSEQWPATSALLELCQGPGGRRLARRVAGLLAATEPEQVPAFALLVGVDDGSTAVIVCGAVDVQVSSDSSTELLSGARSATWVDQIVDAGRDFTVSTPGSPVVEPPDWSDLGRGLVPGSGATVAARREAPVRDPAGHVDDVPPSATAPEVSPEVSPDDGGETAAVEIPALETPGGFDVIDLDAPDDLEQRDPLPLADDVAEPAGGPEVDGIHCVQRHLNDPRSRFCRSCGRSLVHLTHKKVRGPRPSLGVLIFDDSTIYSLDAGYLLGRDPASAPSVQRGELRSLQFHESDTGISRVHASIEMTGWDVVLTDLGSSNGTYVAQSGAEQWQPLRQGEPHQLASGSNIRIGERTFTFESPHHL